MFVFWVLVYNCAFSRLEFALQVPCWLYQGIFVAPLQGAPYTCFPTIYLYIHSTARRHPYIRIFRLTRSCTHTCIYSTIHSRSQNSPAVDASSHLSSLVQFFLFTAASNAFVLHSYSNYHCSTSVPSAYWTVD